MNIGDDRGDVMREKKEIGTTHEERGKRKDRKGKEKMK